MDTSTPVVVLKTAPGGFHHGPLCLARSLGRLGVPVYAFHDGAWLPSAVSRYVHRNLAWDFESHAEAASVAHLVEVGREIGGQPILIATDDAAAMLVADHARRLREVFRFPDQPAGLTRTLASKKELFLLCRKLDIPAPATSFPGSHADVLGFLEEAVFPIVVKAIDARFIPWRRGGLSVLVAHTRQQLLEYYARVEDPANPNLMLQEYIPGGPDSIWMFDGYFDARSECLTGFTGQKIRQYPPYTGPTTLGVAVRNDAVIESACRLLKGVGYRGIVDMGYRYDRRDGSYRLLDVNPRIGATFRLFAGGDGLDVARALYLDLTGGVVPASTYRDGRRWWVENYDTLAAVDYWRDGALTFSQWLHSFENVEEAAWFAPDDPLPFLTMCAGFPLKLARAALQARLATARRGVRPRQAQAIHAP